MPWQYDLARRSKEERKARHDTRNQVQECQAESGDKNIKQENTSVKLLYNQKPYKARNVKGAQTTCRRGGKEKKRSRAEIKEQPPERD